MLSLQLAHFIARTTYEDLPEDVRNFTKLCILDWYGSALAGKDKPPVQMILDLVREMGGNPHSTLITGEKTSAAQAALVNGAASHIVELDDIHKGSIIHAATVVIPAAWAVAEWKRKSGKELLAAIAIGYDVCYRIGEAVSPSHYYYWHNTATCGTFGAAAAAASLLWLAEEEIVHALGSAGTQAAGLWEFIEDGAMSKQLHPGKAAYNGVLSACLADKGFTGAKKILEGNRGFFKAMSKDWMAEKITDGLGETFKIMENSFKIHASCRHTHSAVDLVLDLLNTQNISVSDILAIEVKTYKTALDITDNPAPESVYASKFSIQFCVALAFLRRKAGLDDFNDESLHDPEIRALMEKVEVAVDPEIDAAYPEKWGARVELILKGGKQLSGQTDYPKGDPENAVSAKELIEKLHHLASGVLGADTNQIVDGLLHLEQQDEPHLPVPW